MPKNQSEGKDKKKTQKPEVQVKRELSHVEILITHAGPHGSFVKGDKPVLEKSVARELERCRYAEILSTATEVETAAGNDNMEKR